MKRSAILICLLVSSTASAHFKLNAPASRSQQDGLGGPQKSAPCGLSDDPNIPDDSTPTNAVTTYRTGSTITVSLNETIPHPGHYRVAIAQDIAGLPADPAVTPGGGKACGSTTISASPTLPLLADGQLVHTGALSGTQTFDVQLPAGMTCTNCVLQVVEFMSNHGLNNPGGCYYHHCAIVTISDDAPAQPDAGPTSGNDAGTTPGEAGGGCATAGGSSLVIAAFVVGVVGVRRRRRR